MAMKKISDLTEATSVTLTDLVEIEAAAGSRRAKKVNMLAPTIESVSVDHTIDDREDSRVILMTTGAIDRTCALPDSSTDDVVAGDEFELHKVDAGAGIASLTRQGTDTIDGETAIALPSQYNYARARYLGGGLYSLVAVKATFDSGWVANSDWTNAEFTVTHKLNTPLAELIVKFFISTGGTDATAFEREMVAGVGTANVGVTFFQTSTNAIKIQTGAHGLQYIQDDGTRRSIDIESWYYRVRIYRLVV